MKKVLFILMALVLALSVGLIGCGAPAEEEEVPPRPTKVVIGVSSDLSGPLKDIRAAALSPILAVYLNELNAAGGLLLKEYGATYRVPVEVKEYDDGGDIATMIANTEKLITQDKVDFMFGATGTAMISAQASVVNGLKYVLLTFEGGATQMKETLPGMPYVFVNLSFSDWYQMPVLAKMLKEKGASTAYVVWIEDLHGIEYNGQASIAFAAEGITVVKSVGISADPATAAAQAPGIIADAKDKNADVFCMFCYPAQIFPLTGQAIAQGFNPKAMIGGPGANFGFYHIELGGTPYQKGLTEGIMCFAIANSKTSPAMKTMYEKMEAFWNTVNPFPGASFYLKDFWGHPIYWSVMQIWQKAVEDIGYVNQDKLKDALKTGTFNTILSPMTTYKMFGAGGGLLDYKTHTGEIGQWQNGYIEIVGYTGITSDLPNYKVTAPFIYPKPAWPAP